MFSELRFALDMMTVTTRLTATPTPATTIRTAPSTGEGRLSRTTASNVTRTETTRRAIAFPAAARISARFMPYVCDPVSGRAASWMAHSDPAMAPTSTSMCPASASRASELAYTAAPTSKAMKVTSSASAAIRARRSISADGLRWARSPSPFPCRCASPMATTRRHVVRVREHLFDQPPDVGVVEHVADPRAPAAAPHQPGQAELGQVLGDGGRLGADPLGQLVDRVLALEQGPDHPQAGLVAEQLQHPDGGVKVLGDRCPYYLRRHADTLIRLAALAVGAIEIVRGSPGGVGDALRRAPGHGLDGQGGVVATRGGEDRPVGHVEVGDAPEPAVGVQHR